jgi:inositol polyphosphate 5-phosphatase INPP5B/F
MSTMANESQSSNDHDHRPGESFEHVSMPTTSTPHSLSRAVYERRSEYTRPHTIKIKVGSWNVAALKDVEKDIGPWFVEGRGVEEKLSGLHIAENTEHEHTVDGIESVKDQEERQAKKQSTLPLNDHSTVVGGEHVDIYALGLQEVVELSSAKEYIGRVYSDPGPALRWTKAIAAALPEGYQLVSEQQLSGLLLLIYASPKIAPTISSISSVSVGTGFLGYLGNKGAVITRIVLGETTRLVFVNCHLASGTGPANLERRCWDVTQILERTHFDPISRGGVLDDKHEAIGDEDFAFWFGDLNFRLEGLPGEDIRRLLMLHTKGEYNVASKTGQIMQKEFGNDDPIVIRHVESDDDESLESPTPPSIFSTVNHSEDTQSNHLPDPDDFIQDPHSDPASLQATIDSLLPHDELRHVQKKKLAFHDGWREGPITFLPTYKYDLGSMGLFDSSEKKRAPSWCDRILFRTRRDKLDYDGKSQEEELARLKDEEMKARGIDRAADDEDVLFEYDPESDGVNVGDAGDYDENEDVIAEAQDVITKEGYVDTLTLDVYTSHQRVLSSDHKPLDAVFTLSYDAVVPELKSKVQQEVARELDRAENEGRPSVTIVVDHSQELDDVALPKSSERYGKVSAFTFHYNPFKQVFGDDII